MKRFALLGILAVVSAIALVACDLTGSDVGLLDGAETEISELGIVWQGDEFELTGTVSELTARSETMTVSYPADEGVEETVLVTVPEGMLIPALNEGDLVVIRGTRDVSGSLMAGEIERIGRQGRTLGNEP